MDEKEELIKEAEEIDYLKWDCPYKSLSEVGSYCYASLCAVSLNKLYQQDEHDKEFITQCIEAIGSHLEQPTQVVSACREIAINLTIDDETAFITGIKEEDIIKKHGAMLIPKDLVLIALKDGGYDSRMRTLIKFISLLLMVDYDVIEEYEEFVVKTFEEEEHQISEEEAKESASKAKTRKIKKYALIGAATAGGGVLLGLTGGLAAPLIAAGTAALIGGAGAGILTSTAGIAVIGSLFGVAGAGLGGYKMNKRVGDVKEFAFEPLSESSQLHVTIAVSGWITDECPDFCYPWRGLANSKEQYSLRYESKYLKEMGGAIDYLFKAAVTQATSQALRFTVLSSLMAAIAWPATVLAAASVIDNPWSVMTHRSVAAGRQLCEVLLSRQQGRRPVTLIGFSLGARVIFYCLQEMVNRKKCEGIIEDVILLGAPVPANPDEWKLLKRVVAGKIINGYCRGDWLLKFVYRTGSVQYRIAGLQAIEWRDRRMHNIDLSDILDGHMDYMNKLDHILEIIGIRTKPKPPEQLRTDSLKQWVQANRSRSQSNLNDLTESQSDNSGLKKKTEHAEGFFKSHNTDPDLQTGTEQAECDNLGTQDEAHCKMGDNEDVSIVDDQKRDDHAADDTKTGQDKETSEEVVGKVFAQVTESHHDERVSESLCKSQVECNETKDEGQALTLDSWAHSREASHNNNTNVQNCAMEVRELNFIQCESAEISAASQEKVDTLALNQVHMPGALDSAGPINVETGYGASPQMSLIDSHSDEYDERSEIATVDIEDIAIKLTDSILSSAHQTLVENVLNISTVESEFVE